MIMKFFRWLASFGKSKTEVNRPDPVYVEPIPVEIEPIPVPDRRTPTTTELLTNDAGIDLIIHFEGFYSKPYLCPANIPTIGYGTIEYPNGKKVTLQDDEITKSEGRKFLMFEINEKEDRLEKFRVDNRLSFTENEFSALVSFAYNLGNGPIVSSGKSMNKALLSRDRQRIADAFLIYNKARVGIFRRLKPLAGLTRRRKAERKLFLDVNY